MVIVGRPTKEGRQIILLNLKVRRSRPRDLRASREKNRNQLIALKKK